MTKLEIFDDIKSFYSRILSRTNTAKYKYFSEPERLDELNEIVKFYTIKKYNLIYPKKTKFNFSQYELDEIYSIRNHCKARFILANNPIIRQQTNPSTFEVSSFIIFRCLESLENLGYCFCEFGGGDCRNIIDIIRILYKHEEDSKGRGEWVDNFTAFFKNRFVITNAAKDLLVKNLTTDDISKLSTDEYNFLVNRRNFYDMDENEKPIENEYNIDLHRLISNYLDGITL